MVYPILKTLILIGLRLVAAASRVGIQTINVWNVRLVGEFPVFKCVKGLSGKYHPGLD
jgi:hypothetical protein